MTVGLLAVSAKQTDEPWSHGGQWVRTRDVVLCWALLLTVCATQAARQSAQLSEVSALSMS